MSKKSKRIKKAIGEAVAVIYFNDNSDYLNGLYAVLKELGGQKLVDFVYADSSKAYAKYSKMVSGGQNMGSEAKKKPS